MHNASRRPAPSFPRTSSVVAGRCPSAIDVVEQRIDRHLASVRRLALQTPQQGVGEQPVPDDGGLLGGLGPGVHAARMSLPSPRTTFKVRLDDLSVVRSVSEVTGHDPPAVAEVEPEESPLARRGVERLFDPPQRDALRVQPVTWVSWAMKK